ncbi:hypothetical protein M9Y10_014125 [Tritrichomonas musculus]|uniref:Uncharacterized protein n=1 Tax=Tritrichomonas musculus TaxID=1915356 RepID=A0ABR2KYM8_9EUKA
MKIIIEQEIVRYQFNNKFVQSIESPRVKGKIRGHITDLLYNTGESLENSINKSLYTNLLRLEIMFNINSNTVNEEYIYYYLNYLKEMLPIDLIYYSLISK